MKDDRGIEVLAQRGIGTVDLCAECDIVHVHVDALSVRFKSDSFRDFCRLLAMALDRLNNARGLENDSSAPGSRIKDGLH